MYELAIALNALWFRALRPRKPARDSGAAVAMTVLGPPGCRRATESLQLCPPMQGPPPSLLGSASPQLEHTGCRAKSSQLPRIF